MLDHRTHSTMVSTLAKMEISITKQVRAKRDAMTFTMVNNVNFHTVEQFQEELTDFASFFPFTAWGGGTQVSPARTKPGQDAVRCEQQPP